MGENKSTAKIIDEFTDLAVSRQRKWQLRHPDKNKSINTRHHQTEKFKTRNANQSSEWRKSHPDYAKEYCRGWRERRKQLAPERKD